MAVVEFKEIHNGRDGDGEVSRTGTVARYTRCWRARTNSPLDNAQTVMLAAPAPGDRYPGNAAATLRKVRVAQEPFSKLVWIVSGLYSTEYELEANPLTEPAEVEWETTQSTRIYEQDINGHAIVNAAGDPFDPPVEDADATWCAVITKNVAAVASWFKTYRLAINSDAFTLDGVSFAPREMRIQSIQLGKWQSRNDVAYRVLTIRMEFRENGWQKEIVQAGYHRKDPEDPAKRIACIGDDGKPVSKPVLLDADGNQIADPKPEDAVYATFDIFPERPFAALPIT